jgi:hypothetical protein
MTPDQSKPFEIECDASKYATGAILYQKDDNGYKHPINFYSKTSLQRNATMTFTTENYLQLSEHLKSGDTTSKDHYMKF